MAVDVSHPITVIHLGPSLAQQGGMATVQTLLLGMTLEDVCLKHISTHDEGSVRHRLGIFARALGRCWGAIWRDRTFAIAHLHMSERGSVGRVAILVLLLTLARKKIIIHTHGAEFREFYDGQSTGVQHVLRAVLGRCDRLIALSESWADYYAQTLEIPRDRVCVFHNPVQLPPDPTAYRSPTPQPFRLVFLGRIGDRKGTFLLLRAVADFVKTSSAPVHLTVAGDGEVETAKQLAADLGIREHVEFPGWLDRPATQALLASAHAFILPSLNEGLPMAILEAMSWGLPVIASAVGGIPEVIFPMKTGILVDPQDQASITAAIATLVNDPALAQSLGDNARTMVEAFSSATYQQRLTALYQDLARNFTHPAPYPTQQ